MNRREKELLIEGLRLMEKREKCRPEQFPEVDLPRSEKYIRTMEAMLAKMDGPSRTMRWKKVVAVLAAALIATFLVACAFREPLLNLWEDIYDSFTRLSTQEDAKEYIEEVYLPTWAPEGYLEASRIENVTLVTVNWKKGDETIVFRQSPLNSKSISLDTEQEEYQTAMFGEQPVYYIEKNQDYMFVWENDEYSFLLRCPISLAWEDIERMIGSITPIEE